MLTLKELAVINVTLALASTGSIILMITIMGFIEW